MFPRTYPPGLTTEIISRDLLTNFDKQICNKYDREHLTTYFYDNPNNINIKNISNPNYESLKKVRLVVDTNEDLEKAKWIAKHKKESINGNDTDSIISLALRYVCIINCRIWSIYYIFDDYSRCLGWYSIECSINS